ncbi:5-formyltetrahydrofolate cyclo-ligase, partial [Snodgrassella alvi SCGC AB-598-J21]
DATLSAFQFWQPKLIGAGFACQRLQEIQTEKHDIKIPYFVCEQGIVHFKLGINKLSA